MEKEKESLFPIFFAIFIFLKIVGYFCRKKKKRQRNKAKKAQDSIQTNSKQEEKKIKIN